MGVRMETIWGIAHAWNRSIATRSGPTRGTGPLCDGLGPCVEPDQRQHKHGLGPCVEPDQRQHKHGLGPCVEPDQQQQQTSAGVAMLSQTNTNKRKLRDDH